MITACTSTCILNVNIQIKFFIDLIHLKTLNDCYSKTTYLIELKHTGPIECVNKDLYTNFQGILNFHKNFRILSLKLYRGHLWSCKHTNKLKELKHLLIQLKKMSHK